MKLEDSAQLIAALRELIRRETGIAGSRRTRRMPDQQSAASLSAALSGASIVTMTGPTGRRLFTIGFDGFGAEEDWELG